MDASKSSVVSSILLQSDQPDNSQFEGGSRGLSLPGPCRLSMSPSDRSVKIGATCFWRRIVSVPCGRVSNRISLLSCSGDRSTASSVSWSPLRVSRSSTRGATVLSRPPRSKTGSEGGPFGDWGMGDECVCRTHSTGRGRPRLRNLSDRGCLCGPPPPLRTRRRCGTSLVSTEVWCRRRRSWKQRGRLLTI